MRFIMETITGRKGIKSFETLNEYIDFMTKNGDKIKTIVEADLPYDDKPVSVATPSQSNGWEQVKKATFGDVIKKAEKGDCVLPHKTDSVFKDEAKFEPSKSSEKADSQDSSNPSLEKDLPKFEYKDDSESSSEKSEPKEEKKDSEEKDDKKEIKESLEDEDDVYKEKCMNIINMIPTQDENKAAKILDKWVQKGNITQDEYNYIMSNWDYFFEPLEEGFKDKFKKAVATGAMAASLAAAGNAHGMDKDPYYDGATRPFEDSYEQVSNYDQPKIAKVTKDGMIIDTNGDEWTKKQWEALMNGEDPYYDGATKPFTESVDYEDKGFQIWVKDNKDEHGFTDCVSTEYSEEDAIKEAKRIYDESESKDIVVFVNDSATGNTIFSTEDDKDTSFDDEIAETLRIAGVQLNESSDDEVEETPNHDEDGEIDEKSGKEKLFEEDPEGSKKKSLADAKKELRAARDNLLQVENGDDFAASNGSLDAAEKRVKEAEDLVKSLGGNPFEKEPEIAPNPDDFEYKIGQKFQNAYHPEYKIEITGYKAGVKGADNIYTCKDIGKPSGREDINDRTIQGSWVEI